MGIFVIACYHPKPGLAHELNAVVARHHATLLSEGLVSAQPSITMKSEDGTVVEVFEWLSRESSMSAHTNPVVQALWQEFARVCDFVPLASLKETESAFAHFERLGE